MTERAPVDMWQVYCARCNQKVGCTNGNGGIEVPIICSSCEPQYIKEADEIMVKIAALAEPST